MGWFGSSDDGTTAALLHAVIASAFAVRRELGGCFAPQVYRAALRYELERQQVRVEERPSLVVKYLGRPVGEFQPDLLVGERVLAELETAPKLSAQRLEDARRVLAAARLARGVVLNFGAPKLEYRRVQPAT